jgi:hypothetical protein
LADGIHSTNTSRRGLVEGNLVYQTGDDMVAVVSYAGERPSGNILINDNHVSGNTWGRGITCVGCTDVAITNNTISDVPCCAGVYVSNEAETIGVDGVLVKNNAISNIETRTPCCGGYKTGHGGIDVNGVGTYPIRHVSIENNSVVHAEYDGIRILDYGTVMPFEDVNLNGNAVSRAGDSAVEFIDDPGTPTNTTCWNNTYGGRPYAVPATACTAKPLTSAAWPQFDFERPEGSTWAPDGAATARPWSP